jgi:inner membrane protein
MPTIFTHAFVGLTGSQVFRPPFLEREERIFIGLSIVLPILPDADGLFLLLGWIPYGHALGHRGFAHSLVAAALIGVAATILMARISPTAQRQWPTLFLYFGLLTASHGILDMATLGGLGIALFAPFDNTRLFLPFRPIFASPMNPANFLSWYGLKALVSEAWTIWTICLALLILTKRFSKILQFLSSAATNAARMIEKQFRLFITAALIIVALVSWLV